MTGVENIQMTNPLKAPGTSASQMRMAQGLLMSSRFTGSVGEAGLLLPSLPMDQRSKSGFCVPELAVPVEDVADR